MAYDWEKMTAGELLTLVREKVPDENLLKLLYGNRLPTERSVAAGDKVIHAVQNLFVIGFLVSYAKWRTIKNPDEKTLKSRIHIAFEDAFISDNANFDLMTYVLIEILMDIKVNPDTKFSMIMCKGNDEEEFNCSIFQKALGVIKSFNEYSLSVEISERQRMEMFLQLLDILWMFRNARLVEEEGKFSVILRELGGERKLSLGDLFISYESEFYYLFSETIENGKRRCQYVKLNGFGENSKDIYVRVDDLNEPAPPKKRNSVNYLRRLFSVNYKNLRECSFVIADAVTKSENDMNRLIAGFNNEKYGRLFVPTENADDSYVDLKYRYNWDNIVTMLIVELGPSEFLNQILDEDLYMRILVNISKRYADSEKLREWRRIIDEQKIELFERIDREIRDADLNDKWKKEQARFLWSKGITDALCSTDIVKNVKNHVNFVESIHGKYKKLEKQLKQERSIENITSIAQDLLKVFKFLIAFYNGMLGFAEQKKKNICEKTKEDFNCSEMFKKRATEAYSQVAEIDRLTELNQKFIELCESFVKKTDIGYSLNKDRTELLYLLINRVKICELSEYESIVGINEAEFPKSKNVPRDIYEMLDNFMRSASWQKEDVDVWLSYILDLYKYLIYGSDYARGATDVIENIMDPIYPFVVTYQEKNIDRDLYKRCSYKMPRFDGSNSSRLVKLLTDAEYAFNVAYYCIPQREGSSENWWITPFMVEASLMDDIIG